MYAVILKHLRKLCSICGKKELCLLVNPEHDDEIEILKNILSEDESDWCVCQSCLSVLEEKIGMKVDVLDYDKLLENL